MVWGCFVGDMKGPLVALCGKQPTRMSWYYAKHSYHSYKHCLHSFNATFIYQQDNAKIHTARVSMQFLQENSITIMEWPPNSPDMNPIEHLWHCLRTQLHKQFPDTPLLGGGPDTVRQSLEERLIVVWESIVRERLAS